MKLPGMLFMVTGILCVIPVIQHLNILWVVVQLLFIIAGLLCFILDEIRNG